MEGGGGCIPATPLSSCRGGGQSSVCPFLFRIFYSGFRNFSFLYGKQWIFSNTSKHIFILSVYKSTFQLCIKQSFKQNNRKLFPFQSIELPMVLGTKHRIAIFHFFTTWKCVGRYFIVIIDSKVCDISLYFLNLMVHEY
jgi:hypothetical protein